LNTTEDRLRDAYQAAAQTVRPETIRQRAVPPQTVTPGGRRRLRGHIRRGAGGGGRHTGRLLIPLGAAAAVTAVVVTASLLAQRALPGHDGSRPAAAAPLGTPRFLVAMTYEQHPALFVVNAVTGARGASVPLPFPAADLIGVSTGDGRTFVAETERENGCRSTLYRFRVTPAGQPGVMTEFASLPGSSAGFGSTAVSANGQTVAYDALACGAGHGGPPSPAHPWHGFVAVVNTATGQARRWPFKVTGQGSGYTALHGTEDVSLSTDGRTVAFSDWVLGPDTPPGPLTARGRVLAATGQFGTRTGLDDVGIAPDGRTAYLGTFRIDEKIGKPAGGWQIRSEDLSTRRSRVLHTFPGDEDSEGVTPDPTGRYLLAGYVLNHSSGRTVLVRLDLATGKVTRLNSPWAQDVTVTLAW
jgi:hypothetical protein